MHSKVLVHLLFWRSLFRGAFGNLFVQQEEGLTMSITGMPGTLNIQTQKEKLLQYVSNAGAGCSLVLSPSLPVSYLHCFGAPFPFPWGSGTASCAHQQHWHGIRWEKRLFSQAEGTQCSGWQVQKCSLGRNPGHPWFFFLPEEFN